MQDFISNYFSKEVYAIQDLNRSDRIVRARQIYSSAEK
jgi:hypothetical protein